MGICAIRGHDKGGDMITGYCSSDIAGAGGSTLGMYSSDVGKIVVRSSNGSCFIFAIGATAGRSTSFNSTAGKLYGYLAGLESSPSGIGTTGGKVYINKFNPHREYEITYSTVYSATLPAATDLGKLVGIGATTTIAGCVLSMGMLTSTGIGTGTTKIGAFQLTGFDNNRRKAYVRPVFASDEFAW